jgi:hypothetical protein
VDEPPAQASICATEVIERSWASDFLVGGLRLVCLPGERQEAGGQIGDEVVHGLLLASESRGGDSRGECPEVRVAGGDEAQGEADLVVILFEERVIRRGKWPP